MARYGAEHKERTRRRIVETSGRRFKAGGLAGSGVAALMADAGLTNGAFYGHFASKDDLVAGVIADQLGAQRDRIADADIERVVRAYLSAEHRDHPAEGCTSAALLSEIAHSGETVRQAYTAGLLGVVDAIAARLEPGDPASVRVQVLAVLTGMFGTLQTARAITDRRLSDELLERGADIALAQLGLRGSATDRGSAHAPDHGPPAGSRARSSR
ncbi:TetR/AcrR family transcriptional regulator [Pseudonocardia humida]|uniref:TetR/AcrR family transcriptional regulator n=1 Tax=Pseudonocardia humida TaxID=2800819 RepID=A0ABT1AC68_9PSEU|nr:TetR/AcrR family transcriptional regulator [Pseudonocardia humida]MCO1660593.1 TetR/AcrR family transcriptional regulator [Pseudonocardia humida]